MSLVLQAFQATTPADIDKLKQAIDLILDEAETPELDAIAEEKIPVLEKAAELAEFLEPEQVVAIIVAHKLIALQENRWIPVSERLPEVNSEGESQLVQFCVYWKSTNRMAVFDAIYLNEKVMRDTYDDEYAKFTGWHTYSYREDAEYPEIYEPITLDEGDYIVGWQPFAAAPALPAEVQP